MATITVFVFPPSESWSSRVSFESRYGMCCDLPSTNAEITLPSADSDRLILVASFRRSPVACVFACRSDPARSTRLSFPIRMLDEPSGRCSHDSTVIV